MNAMMIRGFPYAISSWAAALLLAGCGASQSQPPIATDVVRATQLNATPTDSSELLFVSDAGTNDVYILTLPALKLKKTIGGFDQPYHLCSDNDGNVWVPNLGGRQVLEYNHQGKRINSVSYSSYGYPDACAAGPGGLLAVFGGPSYSNRNLELYFALEVPIKLTIAGFSSYDYGAYDSKGNLFVDGTDTASKFVLGVVPPNKTKGHLIDLTGGTIHSPGFVQWYAQGDNLVVADENCKNGNTCIYTVKIAGSKGTITGAVDLLSPSGRGNCGVFQAAIDPTTGKDIAGNIQGCHTYASVDRWAYPAGGTPTNSLQNFVKVPIGAAISAK